MVGVRQPPVKVVRPDRLGKRQHHGIPLVRAEHTPLAHVVFGLHQELGAGKFFSYPKAAGRLPHLLGAKRTRFAPLKEMREPNAGAARVRHAAPVRARSTQNPLVTVGRPAASSSSI